MHCSARRCLVVSDSATFLGTGQKQERYVTDSRILESVGRGNRVECNGMQNAVLSFSPSLSLYSAMRTQDNDILHWISSVFNRSKMKMLIAAMESSGISLRCSSMHYRR